MMRPREVIEVGAIVLRRWRTADAPAACAAVQESLEHLHPWVEWAHLGYGMEDAEAFLEKAVRGWRDGGAFDYGIWVEGGLIGSSSLMNRVGPGALEIGYWVHKDHTGRGYATAAARALTEEALRLPGIERVVIKHDANNAASEAVPRRLGFTRIGQEASETWIPAGSGINMIWEHVRHERS